MQVFIAGGSGLLGRAAIREFREHGHAVTALVRSPEASRRVQDLGARAVSGDIFEPRQVLQAAEGAEAILHLATAIPAKPRPAPSDWAANDRLRREGTRNLLDAGIQHHVQAYIQQSIAFLYGDLHGRWVKEDEVPRPDPITLSAVDGENLALEAYHRSGLPSMVLRGASFYSAENSQTRDMIEGLKRGIVPLLGSGQQYCHWVHVQDMARAVVQAVARPAPGEVFFVADDWPVHSRELLDFLADKLRVKRPRSVPTRLALLGGAISTRYLSHSARYCTDKIKQMLGWSPQFPTFQDGFAQVLAQLGIPT